MKLVALISCLSVAVSASFAFDLRPSVKDQIQIGHDAAAKIRKEEKVLPDQDPRVQFIRKYGAILVGQIPEAERKKRPFEYSFDVIDSKEINAFALPGGPIFFYTGLIDKMTTEDQFIGVLGHEITHIRNQHWASQYADATKRRLGLAVILTLLNANDTLYNVADIVDTAAYELPYSRSHESEADKFGYDLMISKGYNPAGMADVFRILANGQKLDAFSEILSTHPDSAKRAAAIEKRLSTERRERRTQVRLPFNTQAIIDANKGTRPGTGNALLMVIESNIAA